MRSATWLSLAALLACASGCRSTWTGRYTPVDASVEGFEPAPPGVELRLEETTDGGVRGELRSHDVTLDLALQRVSPGSVNWVWQKIAVPAPLRLGVLDVSLKAEELLEAGPYRVDLVRDDDGLILLFHGPEPDKDRHLDLERVGD